jgi:alkanesulfonate monooxygenase SsuD/methylene tetrahydromethanopterin reductase-like flavin-dependent oxidoreductase (luciferase family)
MDASDFSIGAAIWGFPPAQHREFIALVKHAEELGFHSVALGHMPLPPTPAEYPKIVEMMPEGLRPYHLDPLAVVPILLHETKRLRVGFNVLITPTIHPFHLAKYLATLDVIGGGRLVAGFGLGAAYDGTVSSLEKLGTPSRLRGRMSDEALDLMTRLWTSTEPFTFEGEFWTAIDAELAPQPSRKPYPELWWAGDAQASIDRAARFGFDFLELFVPTADAVRDFFAPNLADANRRMGGRARLADLLIAEVLPYDPSEEEIAERLVYTGYMEDGPAMGTPERCAETILKLRDAGVEHFVLNFHRFGADPIERNHQQMEAWVSHVVPLLN